MESPGLQRKVQLRTLEVRKVKSRSLFHRFLIASHSPNEVVETGLRWRAPEKKAANTADCN
jgi:hypothetical protein